MRIADLLQRIVAEWEIPFNKLFKVFTHNGNDMVAAFKGNDKNEDGIAKSDTDSITLEESKELFTDQDELNKWKRVLVLK